MRQLVKAVIYAIMGMIIVYFGTPLLWLITSSIDPLASPMFRIPEEITLKWFADMFEPVGGRYAEVIPFMWIINSLIISTSTATLTTALSIIGGYSLSRYRFKGQEALLRTFIVLRLMPEMVIAIPIVVMFSTLRLLNTYHGVILALTGLILPFTLLIAEGYIRGLPTEYEEAALVDGCSRFSAFIRVTLPMALPGIATIWLLSFVTAWGSFLIPLVTLRSSYLWTASIGIYYWFGAYGRVEYGRISAFSIIYSIPTIIVFLVIRKYLARGIAGLVTR